MIELNPAVIPNDLKQYFRPKRQYGSWVLRNVIIWYKSNPMPESVKDRFTGTYEDVFFFTKSRRYFFEQQFEDNSPNTHAYVAGGGHYKENAYKKDIDGTGTARRMPIYQNPLGRNKRDVWEINTQPYPEAHFATFPEDLCKTPILAGCPLMICKKCGKAREKIYEQDYVATRPGRLTGLAKSGNKDDPNQSLHQSDLSKYRQQINREDKGYSDCGCGEEFVPGVVLDPFCGSGTTLAVAKSLGRRAIGIDINSKYCDLTIKRLQEIPIPMELHE